MNCSLCQKPIYGVLCPGNSCEQCWRTGTVSLGAPLTQSDLIGMFGGSR